MAAATVLTPSTCKPCSTVSMGSGSASLVVGLYFGSGLGDEIHWLSRFFGTVFFMVWAQRVVAGKYDAVLAKGFLFFGA